MGRCRPKPNTWVSECRWLANADKGYLLEVDVRYPTEIHDSHDELPFLSKRMEINGVTKLVPNLRNKTKYVVHIRTLAQALEHGLIFIACVINLPCTFNHYLDMSSLQFCFMIWIVVF